MRFLKNLFGSPPALTVGNSRPPDQAVLVHLDQLDLPAEIVTNYDLATIEDQLVAIIEEQHLGEFDGNEVGAAGAVLYMYGPDAQRLFAAVEPILRAYPLCRGGRVVIRSGGPGAPEREVQL
jgi:hypothetical protein